MKRAVLIIFAVLTLLAIPATIFLVMRNQELRQRAAPATTLKFVPAALTKKVGEEFSLEVHIDTADNQVVAAQLKLLFDATKLQAISITNGTLFPNILSSGVVESGTASIAIGAANTVSPIKGTGTAAVVKFKALAATSSPVSVRFASDTFVGALGEGSTNVLTSTIPSTITISGEAGQNDATQSATLTPSLTPTPTSTDSASPSAVTILSPVKNESVASPEPLLQGKAPPGSTVTITVYSNPITVTVTADANGNWSYQLPQPLAEGPHTIVVAAQDPGSGQTKTATLAFVVASGTENGASGSAIPVTGTVETTMLLLGIGALFIVIGMTIPAVLQNRL